MNNQKLLWLLTALTLFIAMLALTGCGGGNPAGNGNNTASRGDFVSNTALATITSGQAQTTMTNAGLIGFAAKYDVKTYKIVYKTIDPAGNLVNASGLMAVPQKVGVSSLMSFQHGTITLDSDAPSNAQYNGASYGDLAAVLASLGYVVVMPDYLGFGSATTGMLHPYIHGETLASAAIDMIRASKTFMQQNNIAADGKLFLAGYSEGGYATLAAQKVMETTLSKEFTITASEPGAGPYDMTQTTQTILASPNLPVPAYVAFVFKAYDSLYNSPSNIGTYFQAAYASFVNTDFNGTKDILTIDADLGGANVATNALFNQVFLTSFSDPAGETTLKANIAKNDVYYWAPQVPTRFFHGTQDDVVPYANTTTTVTSMQTLGAPNVAVANCNAGGSPTNHTNCFIPYFIDAKAYFDAFGPSL